MTDIQAGLANALRKYRAKYGLSEDTKVVIHMPYETHRAFWDSVNDPNPLFFVLAYFTTMNVDFKAFEGEFQHDLFANPPEFIFDAHDTTTL